MLRFYLRAIGVPIKDLKDQMLSESAMVVVGCSGCVGC